MLSYHLDQMLTLTAVCRSRNGFIRSFIAQFYDVVVTGVSVSCSSLMSSAAVAHLCQGLMCCMFRDSLLHNLLVTTGDMSHCCFNSLKQSGYLALLSDSSPRELPLTGCFLFHTMIRSQLYCHYACINTG